MIGLFRRRSTRCVRTIQLYQLVPFEMSLDCFKSDRKLTHPEGRGECQHLYRLGKNIEDNQLELVQNATPNAESCVKSLTSFAR